MPRFVPRLHHLHPPTCSHAHAIPSLPQPPGFSKSGKFDGDASGGAEDDQGSRKFELVCPECDATYARPVRGNTPQSSRYAWCGVCNHAAPHATHYLAHKLTSIPTAASSASSAAPTFSPLSCLAVQGLSPSHPSRWPRAARLEQPNQEPLLLPLLLSLAHQGRSSLTRRITWPWRCWCWKVFLGRLPWPLPWLPPSFTGSSCSLPPLSWPRRAVPVLVASRDSLANAL